VVVGLFVSIVHNSRVVVRNWSVLAGEVCTEGIAGSLCAFVVFVVFHRGRVSAGRLLTTGRRGGDGEGWIMWWCGGGG